ncbi:MAG: hypothetical protein K8R69_06660, partial [Deltaproteobacteria bacterium]|nr:hypothetical protein [Deltaproteobacteria bacterium]
MSFRIFPRKIFATLLLLAVFVPALSAAGKKPAGGLPHWVTEIPIPQNAPMFMVVKGVFASKSQAEDLQRFIQQLMVKIPGDGVDVTEHFEGLPSGKYVVGMLFDTRERAQWWMEFSYRNRKIGRGTIKEVKVTRESTLPYMPSASRPRPKPLVTEEQAMAQAKALPDLKRLAAAKK